MSYNNSSNMCRHYACKVCLVLFLWMYKAVRALVQLRLGPKREISSCNYKSVMESTQ